MQELEIKIYFYIIKDIEDKDVSTNKILMEDFENQSKERQDIFGNSSPYHYGAFYINYGKKIFHLNFEDIYSLLYSSCLGNIPDICANRTSTQGYFHIQEPYKMLFEPLSSEQLKISVIGPEGYNDSDLIQEIVIPKKEYLLKIHTIIKKYNEMMLRLGYRTFAKSTYAKLEKAEQAMREIGIN